MSFFDKIEDLNFLRKKFQIPLGFLVTGIILLKLALVPVNQELHNGDVISVPQNSLFLYAALFFLVGSVVWFLYIFNLIKHIVGYIVMAGLLISSSMLLYMDYQTVKVVVDFENKYAQRDLEIKTRIMDIKAAEIAYKEVNGTYTNSFDDLISFIKIGTKMDFLKIGSLPERTITPEERDYIYGDNRPIDKLMTEIEAAALARGPNPPTDLLEFKRDTNYVPVMKAIFESDRYLDNRDKIGGLIDFHPDSLSHVPYSSLLATLDTASILKGEITAPTLLISMAHPMHQEGKAARVYTVGSIEDNHLRDNWSR